MTRVDGTSEPRSPAADGVEVLVPVWNDAESITPCLQSIFLAFTNTSIAARVILIDDGSEPATEGAIPSALLSHPGFRLIRQPHTGLPAALNLGLSRSTARWLIRVDSDDTIEPQFIQRILAVTQGSNATVVHGDYVIRTRQQRDFTPHSGRLFSLLGAGVAFRTESLREVGGWSPMFWEEFDLYLKLQHQGVLNVEYASGAVYNYNRYRSALTSESQMLREGWAALVAKWPELEGSRMETSISWLWGHDD